MPVNYDRLKELARPKTDHGALIIEVKLKNGLIDIDSIKAHLFVYVIEQT